MKRDIRYGIQFDADRLEGQQWQVVVNYPSGWSVVARFATREDAANYVFERELAQGL